MDFGSKCKQIIVIPFVVCMVLWSITKSNAESANIAPAPYPASKEVTGQIVNGSHVKLFLPNLPYLAISHAINAALIRPANNEKGWQYDLAESYNSFEDRVWEFTLRRGVRFQDGSIFNADSVLSNMAAFQKAPFTFSKLASILTHVEKIDDYKVRFHLSEPYGVFLHDATWLQFYTPSYLKKHGWNGKPTCPNLAEPGLFALGPYILKEGYIEGDRSTPTVVLKADPNYWGEDKPKVETITIYTSLEMNKARDLVLIDEGELDISPIPFADQVETVLSPFAKLAVSPSLNNYALHFNMISGNSAIDDDRIRYVINHAIDQEYLLNLSMLGEGVLSPTTVSPNFYRVREAIDSLDEYFENQSKTNDDSIGNLRLKVVEYQKEKGLDPEKPLQLMLLAQESFLFLIRDIKYFLEQVNIDLKLNIVSHEKQVFQQLLGTWNGRNDQHWDLLLWGNFDWYKHPWAAFFVYKPNYAWSSIPPNDELDAFTDKILQTNVESEEYVPLIAEFIRHVYERNYMVYLPTPNNVFAINKEVVFNPGRSAFIYLRELEVTPYHWSVRGNRPYPKERKRPLPINRQNLGPHLYD